jgi:hypothetical protein
VRPRSVNIRRYVAICPDRLHERCAQARGFCALIRAPPTTYCEERCETIMTPKAMQTAPPTAAISPKKEKAVRNASTSKMAPTQIRVGGTRLTIGQRPMTFAIGFPEVGFRAVVVQAYLWRSSRCEVSYSSSRRLTVLPVIGSPAQFSHCRQDPGSHTRVTFSVRGPFWPFAPKFPTWRATLIRARSGIDP